MFQPQINQRSLVILRNKELRSRNHSRASSPTPKEHSALNSSYRINTGVGSIDQHHSNINQLDLSNKTKFFIKQLDNM